MKLPCDTMVIYSEDPLTAIQYNKLYINFKRYATPLSPYRKRVLRHEGG